MHLGIFQAKSYVAKYLTCSDFVSGFHSNRAELAVEREVFPVLHQDALTVTGYHYNLLDYAVEHRHHRCVLIYRYAYAIVERHFQFGIYRVGVPSEMAHHPSFSRPWQFAGIGFELA